MPTTLYAVHSRDQRPPKPTMPPEPFYAPEEAPDEPERCALTGFIVAFAFELAIIGIMWGIIHAWRLL